MQFLSFFHMLLHARLPWLPNLCKISSFWNWKVAPSLNNISSVEVWLFFFFFFGPVIMSRPSPALPWGLDLPTWCTGCINNTVSFVFFFFVFSHCITKEAQTTVKRCVRRKETSAYCCFTWGTWKWISKGVVLTTMKPEYSSTLRDISGVSVIDLQCMSTWGGSLAKWLELWTCNSEAPSLSPPLTASWIC